MLEFPDLCVCLFPGSQESREERVDFRTAFVRVCWDILVARRAMQIGGIETQLHGSPKGLISD